MKEIVVAVLLLLGTAFMMLAAIGLNRMPDLYTRMSTTSKAATLGAGFSLVSAAVYFGELSVTTRALAAVGFLVLTIPVASHMIARAGYFVGVPLWEGSVVDELHGQYDAETHELSSQVESVERERDARR